MFDGRRPAVFTIGAHQSFADALATGLIAECGGDPLKLASGRILLPNNRAVRTVTEAFVRASGGGLLLPRLVAIGDPEIDERIGGALDPADAEPVPPAVDPLTRLAALARLVRLQLGVGSAESFRFAEDLARTLDALIIEEVSPQRLADAVADAPELAAHWQISLERLRAILQAWPQELSRLGRINLAERRNRLLRGTARRWRDQPPDGFTVAAGITASAPAIAEVLATVARMPSGALVLPALSLPGLMNDAEWEALGPDPDSGRKIETHPQYHLKRLLDRIGVARGEVVPWPHESRGTPPPREQAVAHALAAARFTSKWIDLPEEERQLNGVRHAELPDAAAEAQAIAIALREAVETAGKTAALVTPDRMLAARVCALLARWDIAVDDSAGKPLSQTPPGTLLLAITAAAAERLAPVAALALVKHPFAGAGQERQVWLESARMLDLALRGPRPPEGLAGLDAQCAEKDRERQTRGCGKAWEAIRPCLQKVDEALRDTPTLVEFVGRLRSLVQGIAGDAAWSGPDGRAAAELLADLEVSPDAASMPLPAEDAVPLLRQLLDGIAVRPPYGGHPRIHILGLLEARLQQADLMILGGMNEGTWPALPTPDPWLAPKIRANLGLPGLEYRIGLASHDFASFLGAPEVLITRARRDSTSPTVASRLLLRLQAVTGGLPRDTELERLARALDAPEGKPQPANRPAPRPPVADRPRQIYVTDLDRLKADPFAFYAKAMLRLRKFEPVDADHTAAWKGSAVHEVLQAWLDEDDCDPAKLLPRAESLMRSEALHPMLRALWQPRLMEAIAWIAEREAENQAAGRLPIAAEAEGQAEVADIILKGIADRIDRLPNGRLAILDYKTGKPPSNKAVEEGFALQLGLLGLIAAAGGFPNIDGQPGAHEYWSLAKDRGQFGFVQSPDKGDPDGFLAKAQAEFAQAVARWLTGEEAFKAKLNAAYAPYGDYDQLMRLEEWYGRE